MRKRALLFSCVAAAITICSVAPFGFLFAKSFISTRGGLTLSYYYQVFLAQNQYLLRFWRSLGLCLCITAGQTVVSVLAGFGFAKHKFPGKEIVLFLLMVLMIMPLQVTLVPNFVILEALGLRNTYFALALPMIFVPLGTFIMTRSFQSVPDEVIEAARMDGCRTMGVIFRVAVPMNKAGIVCTLLLSFLDGWNMVEQPMVYLENFERYPISVALASVPPENPTVQLVCCVLTVLPPLFLFLYFNRDLVEGIALGGEK